MTAVYVTRFALTKGILKMKGRIDNGYFYPVERYDSFSTTDFFINREDAKSKAEEMRKKKITSLKKQIAQLEFTDFSGYNE